MRAKAIKVNKSLFVLGSLRKEGMSQEEEDHLLNAIVLPNFSYALPVYGASDSDLSIKQNFLDWCMKRKFMSKNVNIRDLLEKADKTLYKKRLNDFWASLFTCGVYTNRLHRFRQFGNKSNFY